jgi:hypothetical protein
MHNSLRVLAARLPRWRTSISPPRVLAAVAAAAALAFAGVPAAHAGSGEPDIANGTNVPDGGYPWAVSLHTGALPSTANTWCSGSHIAPQWVITAQHCLDNDLDGTIEPGEVAPTGLWVSLNRTRISDTSRGEVIQGSSVVLNNANDIALLRLARPSSAPTVALATAVPAVNTPVTAAGWGFFTTSNLLPDNMQQGQFRVVGTAGLDLLYNNVNNEEMCGGDSGGPVFTQAGGVVRLVAAHTNSPSGCGVLTGTARGSRIDAARAWIRAYVREAYAFVWAHAAAATLNVPYSPSANYSHNSTGFANTVTRVGTGLYRVAMPQLGTDQPSGNVQVTAYGTTANRCKVQSWIPSGTTLYVTVRCHTPAGALANTQFVAQYFRAGAGNPQQQAYLWAHSPTSASYLPSRFYSSNSLGGTNRVTRLGVGVYQASLPGFTRVGGNVQVTAYGSDSRYCKVSSWGVAAVNVRCFTAAGALADSMWSLRYTDRHVANDARRGAYVWANNPTSLLYTPSTTYQWHSQANTITIARSGTGNYLVRIPNMVAYNRTSTMVTGYSSSNATCAVGSWTSNGAGGTNVRVYCRTPAGALTNTYFTLSYLTNRL